MFVYLLENLACLTIEITMSLFKQSLVKLEGWENIVTIISCDMRHWDASEKADILVCKYSSIVFFFIPWVCITNNFLVIFLSFLLVLG